MLSLWALVSSGFNLGSVGRHSCDMMNVEWLAEIIFRGMCTVDLGPPRAAPRASRCALAIARPRGRLTGPKLGAPIEPHAASLARLFGVGRELAGPGLGGPFGRPASSRLMRVSPRSHRHEAT